MAEPPGFAELVQQSWQAEARGANRDLPTALEEPVAPGGARNPTPTREQAAQGSLGTTGGAPRRRPSGGRGQPEGGAALTPGCERPNAAGGHSQSE
eukprot:12200655-Alexandrium_andersonii.AAC.1